MVLFTLGNSSDAFLLFRVQEAIHKSGAVVNMVNNIAPLHEMVSNFGDEAAQSKVINILFLPLVWAFFHIIKVIFSTPLGALSDKIGRKIVINIGWGIYAFVYISFALLDISYLLICRLLRHLFCLLFMHCFMHLPRVQKRLLLLIW